MAACNDISLSQGHTYTTVIRWEVPPIVRKPILAITCPYGAAVIQTMEPHGLLDGWRVAVTNVQAPKEINAEDPNNVRDREYYAATVISADTVELNDLNIADLKPYTADGFLHYNTPANLTGHSARIRLKTRKGGTLLASSVLADAPLNTLGLVIDTVKHTITLTFPATATELLAGKTGWYDVEVVSSDTVPVVTALVSGTVKVEKE